MPEKHSSPSQAHNAQPALVVERLERVFGGKGNPTYALRGLSFTVEDGQFVAVMGPSGSGKTTLLNCIATIDRPTGGQVTVNGTEVSRLRGKALARFRREDLGFIFQDSNLIDTLSGRENIALELSIRGVKASETDVRVRDIAERLGVKDVLEKFPAQMSGGQRQRVAAARDHHRPPAPHPGRRADRRARQPQQRRHDGDACHHERPDGRDDPHGHARPVCCRAFLARALCQGRLAVHGARARRR